MAKRSIQARRKENVRLSVRDDGNLRLVEYVTPSQVKSVTCGGSAMTLAAMNPDGSSTWRITVSSENTQIVIEEF